MKLGYYMLGVLCGSILFGSVAWYTITSPLNECERVHNVYQCKLVPTPVTPDGQPLDMSDPFHPEEPNS